MTIASSSPPVCSQISGPVVAVVRLRVRHVRVLVGLEAAGDLLGEPRRDRVVRLGRVVLDRGRRDHDLGAVARAASRSSPGSSCRASRRCSGSPCCAAAIARPTPVLPEVGSTIVPPGFSFPSRSAASIIARPIRSLTEPPGFRYSSFARMRARPSRREPVEPHDRRVADQVEDGRVLARPSAAEAYPPLHRRAPRLGASRARRGGSARASRRAPATRDADHDPERPLRSRS